MLHEVSYKADKLWDLDLLPDGAPVATVDPDSFGAVAILRNPGTDSARVSEILPMSLGLDALGARLVSLGVRIVVVEQTFVHRMHNNPHTAISGARRSMAIPAYLAGAVGTAAVVTVVWLHPATWQTMLRREGDKGRLKRDVMKARSVEVAEPFLASYAAWVRATKEQRIGYSDATCMAIWSNRVLFGG